MPTTSKVDIQPPMPQKTKDKYGEAILNLPFDEGKSSIVIDFKDRNKVMEHCKYHYKEREYVTRKVNDELRLYRTK